MKIYVKLTILIILSVCTNILIVYGEHHSILQDNNIHSVNIFSQSPLVNHREMYDYSTTNPSEISYIIHYLNSMEKNDNPIYPSSDGLSFYITITNQNNMSISFSLHPSGFIFDANHQYAISLSEFRSFCTFINSLKTGKKVVNDNISFQTSQWAKADIDAAITSNLVPMLNQIAYKDDIDRLEVCQLAANLLKLRGFEYNENSNNPFSDTSDYSVIILHDLGIIDGKTETEFCPYDLITREEAAKILANLYNLVSKTEHIQSFDFDYADKSDISDWALESVETLSDINIFKGDEFGNFNPKDNITKEQLIVTLYRLYNIV